MIVMPYIADRTQLRMATDLIASFGKDAAVQAAKRAERSRDLGNHIHFCRWRQIGRLIEMIADDRGACTLH